MTDFLFLSLSINSSRISLLLWDMAHNHTYGPRESYYTTSHAFIIAYDITDVSSFDSLPDYLDNINTYQK